MTPGSAPWAALVGAACALAPFVSTGATAQTSATIDMGVSAVRYDGFLLSGAAAVTPAVRWQRPGGSLSARGTYLRFESGNRSLQGLITGSLFTRPARRWRGEFSAAAGASSYATFARFWHALGEMRLHLVGANNGGWLSASGGRTSFGKAPRPVRTAALGGWARRGSLTILASASRSFVGDTAYTDIESSLRAPHGALLLEAAVGSRVSSRGGGHGLYGEGSATVALGGRAAIVVSGGRYPTDAISGSIAGRYVTAALRLHVAQARPVVVRDPSRYVSRNGSDGSTPAVARLEIRPAGAGTMRFVVHAPGARVVELAGDFTDWQAVTLGAAAAGTWEVVLAISRGIHRIDVRVDGGEWLVPAGTTRAADDFDGEIGIFVVP